MSDEPETAPDRESLVAVQFEGPLPPPDMLAHYEDVVPGAAERILSLAERQQRHRMGVDERMLGLAKAALRAETIGQYSALIIAVASAVVVIVTAITDPSWIVVPIGIPAFTWTASWALRAILRQPEDG